MENQQGRFGSLDEPLGGSMKDLEMMLGIASEIPVREWVSAVATAAFAIVAVLAAVAVF